MRRSITRVFSVLLTVTLLVSTFGVTVKVMSCPMMTQECTSCAPVSTALHSGTLLSNDLSCCTLVSERHQLTADFEHVPPIKFTPALAALLPSLLLPIGESSERVFFVRPTLSPHESAAPLYLLTSSFLI